ncbi:hypothetical protein AB0L85_29410 [Streptomyces sp. NPDC052051]|uniref:hypothetical protein n=1 Tax=Streptomyces sp. NPDC052051 TaxID=3154649 RepID=UPI00343D2F1F
MPQLSGRAARGSDACLAHGLLLSYGYANDLRPQVGWFSVSLDAVGIELIGVRPGNGQDVLTEVGEAHPVPALTAA